MGDRQRKQMGYSLIYLMIALVVAWLFQNLIFQPLVIRWSEVPYSQFLDQLESGEIEDVQLTNDRIIYTCCSEEEKDDTAYNVVRVLMIQISSRVWMKPVSHFPVKLHQTQQ